MNIPAILKPAPPWLRRHLAVKCLLGVFPRSYDQWIEYNRGATAYVDLRDPEVRNVFLKRSFEPDFFAIASAVLADGGLFFDCGANFGYWSVLVSSAPFGSHKAIAIEPSSQNFPKLANNARVNGNRFELMKCAIGAVRGSAHLSGTKHEAFSIVGGANSGGEDVPVIALDNLIDDGKVSQSGKYLIKLDVEGVEIEAIKGGARLLEGDSVILCEEHGNDPGHTVSRYILEQTPLKLMVHDPRSNRLETVTELSILDRIKVSSHVGYNVFGTASAFWQNRISALNANAARRMQ